MKIQIVFIVALLAILIYVIVAPLDNALISVSLGITSVIIGACGVVRFKKIKKDLDKNETLD